MLRKPAARLHWWLNKSIVSCPFAASTYPMFTVNSTVWLKTTTTLTKNFLQVQKGINSVNPERPTYFVLSWANAWNTAQGFSMPRRCPLSSFNSENREVKLCWIWCCLLQTTWAENQRHKSHPRPFVASWIVNTPADEQPCGKESPCELHICKRNLGKETLGKSPSTQESSLKLRCLSAMQPTLKNEGEKEEKKRKKEKKISHLLLTQQRKCKCVWAQSCTSFERGGQIPNALVNCVNHPSHPQPHGKLQPTHARPPHSQAPSPAFLFQL